MGIETEVLPKDIYSIKVLDSGEREREAERTAYTVILSDD